WRWRWWVTRWTIAPPRCARSTTTIAASRARRWMRPICAFSTAWCRRSNAATARAESRHGVEPDPVGESTTLWRLRCAGTPARTACATLASWFDTTSHLTWRGRHDTHHPHDLAARLGPAAGLRLADAARHHLRVRLQRHRRHHLDIRIGRADRQ